MKKSKRAFTLVEMIVSIAIIALISIMLLGILIPAANLQRAAAQRNTGINNAAQPLELQAPAATAGASISPSATSINLGNGVTSRGTMYQSRDTKNNITLYQFVPSGS